MAEKIKRKTEGPLWSLIDPDLQPLDPSRARTWLNDLADAADEGGARTTVAELLANKKTGGFIGAVMDHSRFLRVLILDDPVRLARLLAEPAGVSMAKICRTASQSWKAETLDEAKAILRRCRAEAALLVALADLGCVWDEQRAMLALSDFADAALSAAASMALLAEHNKGTIALPDPNNPQRECGWILLAMGKLGARELNYSSDVDLIVLFDPNARIVLEDTEPTRLFVRLTQTLIGILQEHTMDGYVLRIDLRLRPDPSSTPVAVSVPAALLYYEAHGQNWERAALIKARPVAGDIAAGDAFLDDVAPFVWRKYLDYAAIADIHSIKRQIHDHRGHAAIAVAGHNLKLGRGGIREIEFFVQTQQLIAGGRNPALRGRRTLDMLQELARQDWVTDETAAELAAGYCFLRATEHRLQMLDDQQTHSLPKEPEDLRSIALLSRQKNLTVFEQKLLPVLETTQKHYAQLFEEAPTLAGVGNLVFTGDEDDPGTLETLSEMGFRDSVQISSIVRGWHYGRYPATRSSTARERLTELTPALLASLGDGGADAAVIAFDRFLARLPAGVQLFSLIASNPWMLSLFSDILGVAPRLAEIITQRPHALDAIIEPAFFGGLPDRELLSERLQQTLADALSFEDSLDRLRMFGQEQSLLIGARIIAGVVEPRQAGPAYTDLADLLIAEALRLAEGAISEVHGKMPGGKVAVVAMGKLGGREMTAASDLDLILLYSFAKKAAASDGDRPIAGGQYYIRLTQRLVTVLSAPTAEGSLYEVDFRLRPSGNAGPLATSIDGFASYQADEAWTWERMALTRARVVAGDRDLARKATRTISEAICRPHPTRRLITDIVDMRKLVEEEKGSDNPWDIKQSIGGLVDIEFIAQYLQLRHAHKHPALADIETERVLESARKVGVLSQPHAETLLGALRLYQCLVQVIRLCVDDPFDPQDASPGLKALLARTGDAPDFDRLELDLVESQKAVRSVFESVLGKLN